MGGRWSNWRPIDVELQLVEEQKIDSVKESTDTMSISIPILEGLLGNSSNQCSIFL